MTTRIQCLKCGNTLELFPTSGTPVTVTCPACMTSLEQVTFPALGRSVRPGKAAEAVLVEGEGTCFFHAQKRAHVPCEMCGRFLCSLCDLEISGMHVCPGCLTTAQQRGKLPALERRRFVPESAAVGLLVLGILLPLAVLTWPVIVYLTVRSFKGQGSLTGKKVATAIIALLLGTLEMGAGVILIWQFFQQ